MSAMTDEALDSEDLHALGPVYKELLGLNDTNSLEMPRSIAEFKSVIKSGISIVWITTKSDHQEFVCFGKLGRAWRNSSQQLRIWWCQTWTSTVVFSALKSKQCSLICQTSDTPFSLQGSIGIHYIHNVIHMECLWKYGATHLMCLDQPVLFLCKEFNPILFNRKNL